MLLSGGIDSATALYLTRRSHFVRALTFEFNGIARRELQAARAIASHAGVTDHRFVRLPDLKEAGDIPGFKLRGLPPTYIPLRNSIFYAFAASLAEETGAVSIVGGHNRDDLKVFDDVSPGFFSALERSLWAGSSALRNNRVRLLRPLKSKTKAEVVSLASSLGVPFEATWSCHRDGPEHCWRCRGCVSRSAGFRAAGVSDPLTSGKEKIT